MALKYNFYGTTVTQGFTNENTFRVNIAEFKESDWLTLDRWQDEFVRYIPVKYSDDIITYNDITDSLGSATNLISYPRCNVLHRTENFGYEYDGDYWTWLSNSFGSKYMTLSMYSQNTNMYTLDMEQHLSNFSREDISGIYLVGYLPSNGIPVVRPIIGINNTRYIIAPILPSGLIDHWHLTKQDTEKPEDVVGKLPANEYDVIGWGNSFTIMRGYPSVATDPNPEINLTPLKDLSTLSDVIENWDNLVFWYESVHSGVEGYLGDSVARTEFYDAVDSDLTMFPSTVGSTLHAYTEINLPKFVTGSRRIDGSVTYSNLPSAEKTITVNRDNNRFIITWTNNETNDVLSNLKMSTVIDGETRNYTYTGVLGKQDEGGGAWLNKGVWVRDVYIMCVPDDENIPENLRGFYLVGYGFRETSGGSAKGNLIVIDKLDGLHLESIFDDWSPDGKVDKFTEDLVEDELGGDLGTGELIEVEDIDSTENPHDGTMGNGTGSVHEGDELIPDPEFDLPIAGGEGSVLGSGFIKVYTPSKTQLDAFTSELLSDSVIDVLKDYFTTNPMEGIIGLSMLPYTGFSSNVHGKPKIGTYKFNTELDTAGKEYLTVDYGTIDVKFSYDGYENYSQYSDCKIFLPHIGYKEIDIDMVQGCRLHLKYLVSLVTGDIYAYLYAKWVSGKDKGANNLDHLLYHWQGNCNMTVPVTHIDKSSYVNGAIQSVGNIASIVSGGMTMNALGGAMAGATTDKQMASLTKQYQGAGFGIGRNVANLGSNIASMFKPSVTTSGSISGACAYMGERTPYLLLSRPIITGTDDIKRHYGLVTTKKYSLTKLKGTGYTELNGVDLNGVSATEEELNELKSILEGGYYA